MFDVMPSLSKHARAVSSVVLSAALLCASATPAFAQDAQAQTAADAMKKLAFLNGSWNCVMHGGASDGAADKLSYSFTADGRWMIERSDVKGGDSSVQVWGYDPAQRRITATLYSPRGVTVKNVLGWNNNAFVSQGDVSGATVALKQTAPNAMNWTFTPPDATQAPVVESCTKA